MHKHWCCIIHIIPFDDIQCLQLLVHHIIVTYDNLVHLWNLWRCPNLGLKSSSHDHEPPRRRGTRVRGARGTTSRGALLLLMPAQIREVQIRGQHKKNRSQGMYCILKGVLENFPQPMVDWHGLTLTNGNEFPKLAGVCWRSETWREWWRHTQPDFKIL